MNKNMYWFLAACLVGLGCPSGQRPSAGSAPENTYKFETPNTWKTEKDKFPLSFAPSIIHQGTVDLRFSPGWSNVNSGEYFAYLSLWWLQDSASFDLSNLPTTIEAYYTGLAHSENTMHAPDSALQAKAEVENAPTAPGDVATFMATATIYDPFMKQNRIPIYIKVHVGKCTLTPAYVLWEVAGEPFSDSVWRELDSLRSPIQCEQ